MASERRLRGLYAVTPETEDTEDLVRRAEACLAGGAALLQYRAKGIAPTLALEQARRLRDACRATGALFIVNDSVDLALATGADGVHVGREDEDVRAARERLHGAILGVTCYDQLERARAARAAGADYVAVGSVFPSPTKPGAVLAPLKLIAQAREASGLPVCAIGGITLQNAPKVVTAGADMLAVISAVFDAPDVRSAAAAFAALYPQDKDPKDVRAQPRTV